jgi:protein gp37
MSAKTGIEWTDATWNPVVGCRKVSDGCKNCYAKTLHDLRYKAYNEGKKMPEQYAEPFEYVRLMLRRLDMPLRWKKPRRIFVNSVSDLFHDDVPDDFIALVMQTIREAHWHTFQVLTKRAARMFAWYERWSNDYPAFDGRLPENLWLGVSVEDQSTADDRLPYLLEIPNVRRFVSCEPLLGPVNLRAAIDRDNRLIYDGLDSMRTEYDQSGHTFPMAYTKLHWVIAGGESGKNARPMHANWARDLRGQCRETGTPFFFKQWGEWCHNDQVQVSRRMSKEVWRWLDGGISLRVGTRASGHLLDGKEWRQVPEFINLMQ